MLQKCFCEQKIGLDKSNCFAYYLHNVREKIKVLTTTQHGRGSRMFWNSFINYSPSKFAVLKGPHDSKDYCNVLDNLIPFYNYVFANYFTCEQHSALILVVLNLKQ